MMSTTHAAMGATIAAWVGTAAPEFAPLAVVAAFLGGLFPDADAAVGAHRRTLHHVEAYPLLALGATALAAAVPGPATVAAAAFLGSAALHCLVDAFGGGLALRPWEADDDRGVYLHSRGRWVAPRRWVRYDGAPEDLLLAAACSVPLLARASPVRWLALAGLVASVGYTAFRRRLVDVAPDLFEVQ